MIVDILRNIGAIGNINAAKKETLISLSGLDDRTLRQAIEDENGKRGI